MNGEQWGFSAQTFATIRAILAQFPEVERAILFGSRAKGNYRPGSDIDLAVVGKGLSFDRLARLARAFEESPLPYQVDLCWWDVIDHPPLRAHIERVGQVLYERGAAAPRASQGQTAIIGFHEKFNTAGPSTPGDP